MKFLVLYSMLVVLAGCGRSTTSPATLSSATPATFAEAKAPYDPVIVPADFGGPIDNPFLPLLAGTTWHYRSTDGELNDVTVLGETKTILDIPCAIVHDVVSVDGHVTEDTYDWYAQNKDGTVWYFGEDTRELDANGNVITTQGSWEAGKDGGKPGILMLPEDQLEIGASYRQEFMPGVVADMGKVMSLKSTAIVPAGTFTGCVETMEWTPIEPGNRAHKFYARGIGPVLEVSTKQGGERLELLSVEKP